MPRRDNDEYKGDPELLRGVTSFDYKDAEFLKKIKYYQQHYIGRPSPLFYASNLSKYLTEKWHKHNHTSEQTGKLSTHNHNKSS